jgi:hypothetical protein
VSLCAKAKHGKDYAPRPPLPPPPKQRATITRPPSLTLSLLPVPCHRGESKEGGGKENATSLTDGHTRDAVEHGLPEGVRLAAAEVHVTMAL